MAKKIRSKKHLTEEEKAAQAAEKELAEQGIQDEFQAKGFELVEWMQEKSGLVLGFMGLVVVAGLVTAGMQYAAQTANDGASAEYAKGLAAYEGVVGDAPAILTGGDENAPKFKTEKERSEAARGHFQAVVAEHDGSGVSNLARLYVGHTSLDLEDYDGAIAAYEGFLKNAPSDDPMRALALDSLATALTAKGDSDGAVKRLEELVALKGKLSEDVALLKIARHYHRAGKTTEAKAAAERIVADFETSPLVSDAKDLLEQL